MYSPVRELKELLKVFENCGPDDQGWSDFGEERANRILASFTAADWDALLEASEGLKPGELDVLSSVIATQSHRHVLPLLVRAVLNVDGSGWIGAAESLGRKYDSDPGLLRPYERSLQSSSSVEFIELQLKNWLNFPQQPYASFDDYVAEHGHLVPPTVLALVAYARRSPNNSLERTRER